MAVCEPLAFVLSDFLVSCLNYCVYVIASGARLLCSLKVQQRFKMCQVVVSLDYCMLHAPPMQECWSDERSPLSKDNDIIPACSSALEDF